MTRKSFISRNLGRKNSKCTQSPSRGAGGVGTGVLVDGGVAGDHADVFRAEDVAEGFELEGKGDQGFSGADGGVEDDFVGGEELEDGFFLVVVGLGGGGGEVVEEDVEDIVRGGVFGEILAAEPADT